MNMEPQKMETSIITGCQKAPECRLSSLGLRSGDRSVCDMKSSSVSLKHVVFRGKYSQFHYMFGENNTTTIYLHENGYSKTVTSELPKITSDGL